MRQKNSVSGKNPFSFLFSRSSNFYVISLLCFFILFTGIIAVSFAVIFNSLKNLQARNMYYTLQSYGMEIHASMDRVIERAEKLAEDPLFAEYLDTYSLSQGEFFNDKNHERLLSAFNSMAAFSDMCIYNTRGEHVLNQAGFHLCCVAASEGTPAADMDFSRHGTFFLETVLLNDRWSYIATFPVHNGNAVAGYVAVLFNTDYFTGFVGRYRFGSTGYMYALTSAGRLLFYEEITASKWDELAVRNPQLIASLKSSFSKEISFVTYQIDNGPLRYANSYYDSDYDFAIVSRINKSEITYIVILSLIPLFLSAFVLLVVTSVAVILLYRRLNQPLRQMIDRCRLIKQGDTEVRFSSNEDRDLNILSETLNEAISSLAMYQKNLENMAYTDPITTIGNRLGCIHAMENLIKNNCPAFSVYMVDIVGFDHFNEIFSSKTGDMLLRQVGVFLQTISSAGAFRYSADVFSFMVPCIDEAGHRHVQEKLRAYFSRPLNIGGNSYPIGMKIARADYPAHSSVPQDLLKNCKTALKYAKLQSGDECVIYNTTVQELIGRKSLVKDIVTEAIKMQNIEVFYQPIYDLKKERFTKAEALLRLPNTSLGSISPEEVVRVAEENGLISELGDIIMQKVCDLLSFLPSEIETIAVNLSVVQIMQYGFLEHTRRLLENSGINTGLLEFEITEGVLISSFDAVHDIINSLKSLGVRLALDDFGSGYSGINYLANLPIDTLKLDRSLIIKLGASERHTKLISSIVDLCRSFNLKVVAEGVEDSTLVAQASNHNIDYIQGFYYSRPLPADEFIAFLKQHNN